MGRCTRGKTLAIKPVGAAVFAAALLLLLGLWAAPQAMTGGRAKELAERALAEGRLGLPEGGDLSGSVFTVQEPLRGSLPKGHHLVSATEKGLTSWFLLTEQPGGKGDFLYLGQSFGDEAAFSIADMGGEWGDPLIANIPTTGTGQTGPYHESALYALGKDGPQVLYCSGFFLEPVGKIDTGFRLSAPERGFVVVENLHTGKADPVEVDIIPQETLAHIYARSGEQCPFTFSYAGDWNNFLSFEPVDTDGDGICELLAWENAFLSSPFLPGSLNFGVFFTLLKYDPAAQGLSVVDSGFWARYSSGETLEEYVANRWR